jgi:hypothetical protein
MDLFYYINSHISFLCLLYVSNKFNKFTFSDRIRTTNNMLGDCYAAAVVEHLSKKELMACDAAAFYQVCIKFISLLFKNYEKP